jgi:SAM-dependent methyltransferase
VGVQSDKHASVLSSEAQRVREIFGRRKDPDEGPFDLFRLYDHHDRQRAIVCFFRRMGLSSLTGLRILDVGCGSGGQLRRLVDFGAEPARCFGIDLFGPAVAWARRQNPNITFLEGSAAELPFASGAFDLVFQFTVFTSVLDARIRREMASEIRRVLRPGGHFIWYDFAYSNYRNPNVRGIGRREIRELLDGFNLRFQRVTLAPPIGRCAAKLSNVCYRALAAIPLLRTHYFCFAQKW